MAISSLFLILAVLLILLALGVIGEYLGKLYLESKGRPRFLIREVLDNRESENVDK